MHQENKKVLINFHYVWKEESGNVEIDFLRQVSALPCSHWL